MTQTQKKTTKRTRPRYTKMVAMVDLFNDNVYRVQDECYMHVGPLPDKGIAVKAHPDQPLGKPKAAPLGETGTMPPPEWTSPGFAKAHHEKQYDDDDPDEP